MVLSQSKIDRKTTRLSGSNDKKKEFQNYRKRKSAKKLWELRVNQRITRGSFSEMMRLFAMLPK
jgi:hypothetical protein